MNEALKRKIEKGPDDTWTFKQAAFFVLKEWRKECEERTGKKFNVEPVNLAEYFPEETE